MTKSWLTGPIAFVLLLLALLVTWYAMEPAALVRFFDQKGYSPFELATLPFFAAIVPIVWWKCPFAGSRRRRTILCLLVSLVSLFAIVKETDLHLVFMKALYPDLLTDAGSLASGFFKPDGRPLCGTPFKLRVLTNAAIPFGMKALVVTYFTLFFGAFAAGFLYLLPTWVRGVFKLDAASWAWGCTGAAGVLVQVSDRIPAWLNHAYGLRKQGVDGVVAPAASLCTCLEEGGEMMIAILAILTILLAYRTLQKQQKEDRA